MNSVGHEAVDGVGVLRQRRAAAQPARGGVGQLLPGGVELRAKRRVAGVAVGRSGLAWSGIGHTVSAKA